MYQIVHDRGYDGESLGFTFKKQIDAEINCIAHYDNNMKAKKSHNIPCSYVIYKLKSGFEPVLVAKMDVIKHRPKPSFKYFKG